MLFAYELKTMKASAMEQSAVNTMSCMIKYHEEQE